MTTLATPSNQPQDDYLVTVCDKCLKSSCWQAIFMCHESAYAGTVEKTVAELRALGLEHEDYFVPYAHPLAPTQADLIPTFKEIAGRFPGAQKLVRLKVRRVLAWASCQDVASAFIFSAPENIGSAYCCHVPFREEGAV